MIVDVAARPTVRASATGRALGAVAVAAPLIAIAARNGGYFPTSWGWGALFFAWCVLVAVVIVREAAVPVYSAAFGAAVAALGGWVWLSSLWSNAASQSILEGERVLVYLTAVATLVVLARSISREVVVGGLLVATVLVSAYALATRLFPERIGRFDAIAGYRLATPIGYWNGLGLFAAMGALLALGFVARGSTVVVRAVSGASLVVLTLAVYFTYSRGSWVALAVGLCAMFALDSRRLQLCLATAVAALAPGLAVLVASRSTALTTLGATLATATHQGHRLALSALGLAGIAVLAVALLDVAERRFVPSGRLRSASIALIVIPALGVGAAAIVNWGSPWHIASRAWHGFTSAPPATGANLNNRLFHLSNHGRIVSWRSAYHEFEHAPIVGTGGGTFEEWWDAHRLTAQQIVNAHSLYLETMGTLGIVGLLLLVGTLLIPLIAAVKARREPLVPFAAAAFVAWIIHAAVDWDWQIPAVTLSALACASVVCAAGPGRVFVLGPRARIGIGVAAAVFALFGIVAGIGNQALASSQNALNSQNYASAYTEAKKAARWAPWLSEPWIIQGQLLALGQEPAAARRDFHKAIAKDPHNYLAWYGLAGVTKGAARKAAVAKVEQLNPLSDEAKELRTGS